MPVRPYSGRATFGLLPEPESRPGSFITSVVINGLILVLALYFGSMAKKVIDQHQYEQTLLILPTTPPPAPPKVKIPPPPPVVETPKIPEVKFQAPKISLPKPEPKPDLKPIQMEAKVNLPPVKAGKPVVILAPQPKAALATAPSPAPMPEWSAKWPPPEFRGGPVRLPPPNMATSKWPRQGFPP